MKTRRSFLAAGLLGATALLAGNLARAHGDAKHGAAKPAANAAPDDRVQQEWGIAGDPREVGRTIPITMTDAMRFVPDRIDVRLGETIRFVHHNAGEMLHEMVIGTKAALAEHAELMTKFPGMEHDDPWMAHVPAGGRGEIVWTFNRPGEFEFACLIPGHYQAGMSGRIVVARG